jgi:predicted aspartyl protease
VTDFSFGDEGVWLPIVEVGVVGKQVPLIFDTGTSGYASLDERTIEALSLPVESWTTFRDASGAAAGRIPVARAATLEVGSVRSTNVEITGLGPESVMGQRLGFSGTLGWRALEGHRFTIDYSNRKIALASSALPEEISACTTRHVSRFVSPPDLDGLILIEGSIEGERFFVQVDTGKSKTVLDPRIESIRTFDRTDRGLEIRNLIVGPFELSTNFGKMGRGFDSFSRGMDRPALIGLGSDILSRFLLTVDYSTRTIILEEAGC